LIDFPKLLLMQSDTGMPKIVLNDVFYQIMNSGNHSNEQMQRWKIEQPPGGSFFGGRCENTNQMIIE
jgi:hypothetical protein